MRIFIFILFFTPFFLSSQTYVDSVFEFDIGDEFHYENRIGSMRYGYKTTKTINKIIGKSYSGNFVSYQIHSFGKIYTPPSSIVSFSNIISKSYDTSIIYFDTIPPCSFCLSDTMYVDSNFGLTYQVDSMRFEYGATEKYSKNLGMIVKSESWSDFTTPDEISEYLVYYRKINGKTWGTPFTFTSSISENSELSFSIYPNPFSSYINIQGIEGLLNYSITNSIGQHVLSGKIQNNKIDCSSLLNGIYFLKVTDSEFKVGIKRVVISK